MLQNSDFQYFTGGSFSDLFAEDVTGASYGFILNYPATASWAIYPNTKQYYLQDGSDEATKTSYDKICQKEPWKNLAVLGNLIPGILFCAPRNVLIGYWQDHLGFQYNNIELLQRQTYLDYLNQSDRFDKLITLFPFDALSPEKHAVNPDAHYYLLSKEALSQMGVLSPKYRTYHLDRVKLEEIELPEYPYLIKATHGLSGEGTYIIKNQSDLDYCLRELNKYLEINLVRTIVVSEFVKDTEQNYCVQFYLSKSGAVTLIGATRQLVTDEGKYLGGGIDYRDDMAKFHDLIGSIAKYAHQKGYFGVIGFDVLEDREGALHVIDANFRVNGSTPLCLQRHRLLKANKAVATYSTDYRMDGTLDAILLTLKVELERKDLIILSALEKVKYGKIYSEIYGIVAGETFEDMQQVEATLFSKGLELLV